MRRDMLSMLANVGLALGSAAATLLACEALTAHWVSTHPALGETASRLRRGHPPPYARSPYYSLPFIEEQEFRGGAFAALPESDIIIVRDAQGAYINNAAGHRVTTDAPATPRKRIFVFGGSTVYSAEVPDPFTIPSYLQRLLNGAGKGDYGVVNAGVTSVNAAQQLSLLRKTTLAPGDLVVFYDGINDLLTGVYYQAARGTIAESEEAADARLSLLQRMVVRLSDAPLLRRSYLLDYVLEPFAYSDPPGHVKDAGRREQLLEQTALAYQEALRGAQLFAEAAGARFFHFLQPNLFSAALRTPYEQALAANVRVVYPGYREIFSLGQRRLRTACGELRSEGIATTDLSAVLGTLPASEDVFLDAMHVTEVANRLVAQAVFASLFVEHASSAWEPSAAEIADYHREDDRTWSRFSEARQALPSSAGRASLLQNVAFADGIAPWAMAQRTDLADGRYPIVTWHNYLRQEIQGITDLMQIEITASCSGAEVVRASLHWADASGYGDLAPDRFSFACGAARQRSVFVVRRPSTARRAGLVIDSPDDDHPVVVYGVDVHPVVP